MPKRRYSNIWMFLLPLWSVGASWCQNVGSEPLNPQSPNLSIAPIILPSTGSEDLPYLIEVAGASDEEILPHEPTEKKPELDLRGKGDYELFQLAGEAYDRDDLEIASAYYHALIDRGVRHGDVYFNLANTYFRMSDKFGWAILFYEKALRLRPRDRILVMRQGEVAGILDREEADQEKVMHLATGI